MSILRKTAGLFNSVIVLTVVGITAFQWQEAVASERLNQFDNEERYCLQQNLYFEARNISDLSMEAVGWVTMNRVDSSRYPNTICDVVWQRRQFSWTHDGLPDRPSDNVLEQRAWERAGRIALEVLDDYVRNGDSPVENAMFYHADYSSPVWRHAMTRVVQIDNHIYYTN